MSLSAAQKKRVDDLHKSAVRKILLAESAALMLVREPVRSATARLQDAAHRSVGFSESEAHRHLFVSVRREADVLRHSFDVSVSNARTSARRLASQQTIAETAPIDAWARQAGAERPNPVQQSGHAAELDAAEAHRAASSMATAWASAAMAGVSMWARDRDRSEIGPSFALDTRLDGRIRRHAATQAVSAYADQTDTYWKGLAKTQPPTDTEPEDTDFEPEWQSGVHHVWSAILDARTCQECWNLDGQVRKFADPFPEPPPIHPFCRCAVVTVFMPETLARKMPGVQIDYGLLKQDIADYFGSSLAGQTGRRHIAEFLRASDTPQGKFRPGKRGTSPEALLKLSDRRRFLH